MVRRDDFDVGRVGPVYFAKKSSGGLEIIPLAREKTKPCGDFGKFPRDVQDGVFFFGFGKTS